ncbi:TlpA disulfide reductase family protein [Clostridium aestuarii]|uniref:TlpA disulfide reductase family protein n=1 Tax=Clostridium aestuarii TaxID=338193 RepID=A0ABT4CVS4_9CLOT|nr:TlpA disulfide reductase family protein [Clostridium aestuarii]MCY6483069.1 TlpA disulfide reductase family protein [Clostridium aestuarii]
MKKKLLSIIIATLICTSMAACGKSTKPTTDNQNKSQQTETQKETAKDTHMKFDEMGLEYDIPETWAEKKGVGPACIAPGKPGVAYIIGEIPYEYLSDEFYDKIVEMSKTAKTEEEQKKLFEEYQSKAKDFCTIMVLDKNTDNVDDKKRKEEVFAKYTHKDKVAKKDNFECYILYNDKYDESGLTDKEKKEFKEVYAAIKDLKKSIKLFKPVDPMEKVSNYKKLNFKTKTLDGKNIDNSVFNDNKLTMVNIWATFCGPCKAEMPDIQELYKEVKQENINVLGIVSDTFNDEENQELAKKIIKSKDVEFTNIIPDESLMNGLLKDIPGVPTTVFVDNKGNIIGEPIVGGNNKEFYKNEIQNRLKTLK